MYNNNNDNNNDWCQKFPGKTNSGISKIKLLLWKKAVLHTNTLMHCKAGSVLRDLLLTKRIPQKWHLWQDLLKPTSKVWKPSYDWMIWCRQQSESINSIAMEDLNLTQILAKVLPTVISFSIKIISVNPSNKPT